MADTTTPAKTVMTLPVPTEAERVIANNQAVIADLEANPRDETIQGGRYKRSGMWVNAKGERIDEMGKVLRDEDY